MTYQVKKGDTLSSVARLYRTTVQSLKVWNRLSGDRLMPGARLTIFASRNHGKWPRRSAWQSSLPAATRGSRRVLRSTS